MSKHTCNFSVGPKRRCSTCGEAKPIEELPPAAVKVPESCSYKISEMDKDGRIKGDVIYAEALVKLQEARDDKGAVEAAKVFKSAYEAFVKAKDGVAAAISASFSESYCVDIVSTRKENEDSKVSV